MINQTVYLNPQLFENVEKCSVREGFGEGLVLAGEEDVNVVALCADLSESVKMQPFAQKFPGRFVEVGVAEQNLVTIASGMASVGKVPFVGSYAAFSPGRNWEQIRTTVCYNNQPVKIVGSHAGISVGPDGPTHQALEDIALMRVLPNMVVISPVDAIEARKVTQAAARLAKPCYIRLARNSSPLVTTQQTPFEIGKGLVMWEGKDVTVFATGQLVYPSLLAARELSMNKISVRVINIHTIKPLDKDLVLKAAEETGAIVTVEEHQIAGGLGSAVAEVISDRFPIPVKMVGIKDVFGQSGEPDELLEEYGLNSKGIIKAVISALRLKNK